MPQHGKKKKNNKFKKENPSMPFARNMNVFALKKYTPAQ